MTSPLLLRFRVWNMVEQNPLYDRVHGEAVVAGEIVAAVVAVVVDVFGGETVTFQRPSTWPLSLMFRAEKDDRKMLSSACVSTPSVTAST